MRRTMWIAVLVTASLLILAGNLPARWPASWSLAWGPLAAALRRTADAALAWLRTPVGTAAAAAALAWLSGLTFGLSVRRADRYASVLREVRRGRATARIARRSRLSQDAVRALLHPARAASRLPQLGEEASGPEGFVLTRHLRQPVGAARDALA